MNDRALRSAVVGLGGLNGGPSREERWVIVPGSEIMAVLCLATDLSDLEARLGRIINHHRLAPGRGFHALG